MVCLNGNGRLEEIRRELKQRYDVSDMMRNRMPMDVLVVTDGDNGPVAYVGLSFYGSPEVSGPGSVLKNEVERLVMAKYW